MDEVKTVSERIVDIMDENEPDPDSIMLNKDDPEPTEIDPELKGDVFKKENPILDAIDRFTKADGPFIKITNQNTRNKKSDGSGEKEVKSNIAVVIGWRTTF
jgi:hypothetical protein